MMQNEKINLTMDASFARRTFRFEKRYVFNKVTSSGPAKLTAISQAL